MNCLLTPFINILSQNPFPCQRPTGEKPGVAQEIVKLLTWFTMMKLLKTILLISMNFVLFIKKKQSFAVSVVHFRVMIWRNKTSCNLIGRENDFWTRKIISIPSYRHCSMAENCCIVFHGKSDKFFSLVNTFQYYLHWFWLNKYWHVFVA